MSISNKSSISLFCGAGGLDVGFKSAGFNSIWANDKDPDSCKTYAKNFGDHVMCGNIDELMSSLSAFRDDDIDCVFGGPPCQGFSVAGLMDLEDPRSLLVSSFMNVVDIVRPKSFLMENVKSLATLAKFQHIRDELFRKAKSIGYHFELIVITSSDYGVPQNRERMFLIGFRDIEIKKPLSEIIRNYRLPSDSVKNTIKILGKAGTSTNPHVVKAKITFAKNPVLRKSPYAGMMFNGQGRPIDVNGFANTIPATCGGNRTPIIDEDSLYLDKPAWIEEYHQHLMSGGDVYSDNQIPTRLRRMTLDEARLIQTFPSDFCFVGEQVSVFSQIGNAVPCNMAGQVAKMMIDILNGKK
jgi:DNA (cytosine-5)-methyltransferase 1